MAAWQWQMIKHKSLTKLAKDNLSSIPDIIVFVQLVNVPVQLLNGVTPVISAEHFFF